MLIILMLMIAVTSLSAFAAPIGSSSLGTPPLRMAPNGPAPTPTPPSPVAPVPAPGSVPRGSLLNMSV